MARPRQLSPEWHAARRGSVTGTDIAAILGVHRFRSEADIAAEKYGFAEPQPPNLAMRAGQLLEPLIAAEYSTQTGYRVRRQHTLATHPSLSWAVASLDYLVIGQRRIMEAKWTLSRARWSGGLPDAEESQVRWQMGVLGIPVADVAALLGSDDLRIFTVEHDEELWQQLVELAQDFRRRLEAGGPFEESADSVKRRYPRDDGTVMHAGPELEQEVAELVRLRQAKAAAAAAQEEVETRIKTRMGEAARAEGAGWHLTWKQSKPITETNWQAIADGLLRQLPEEQRAALVGIHTVSRPGQRPFRLFAEERPHDGPD